MKTYEDYKLIADKIDSLAINLEMSFLQDDLLVNIENAGTDSDYDLLISVAVNTLGQRLESHGLDANDYGFKY